MNDREMAEERERNTSVELQRVQDSVIKLEKVKLI